MKASRSYKSDMLVFNTRTGITQRQTSPSWLQGYNSWVNLAFTVREVQFVPLYAENIRRMAFGSRRVCYHAVYPKSFFQPVQSIDRLFNNLSHTRFFFLCCPHYLDLFFSIVLCGYFCNISGYPFPFSSGGWSIEIIFPQLLPFLMINSVELMYLWEGCNCLILHPV